MSLNLNQTDFPVLAVIFEGTPMISLNDWAMDNIKKLVCVYSYQCNEGHAVTRQACGEMVDVVFRRFPTETTWEENGVTLTKYTMRVGVRRHV